MTDVVISAHCSFIDLLCALFSVRTEDFLLLGSRLYDSCKLFLLCLEVFCPYSDLLLNNFEFVPLLEDALLDL